MNYILYQVLEIVYRSIWISIKKDICNYSLAAYTARFFFDLKVKVVERKSTSQGHGGISYL